MCATNLPAKASMRVRRRPTSSHASSSQTLRAGLRSSGSWGCRRTKQQQLRIASASAVVVADEFRALLALQSRDLRMSAWLLPPPPFEHCLEVAAEFRPLEFLVRRTANIDRCLLHSAR